MLVNDDWINIINILAMVATISFGLAGAWVYTGATCVLVIMNLSQRKTKAPRALAKSCHLLQ